MKRVKISTVRKYEIYSTCFIDVEDINSVIEAALSTRDLTNNLVRVRSSNVWAVGIDIQKSGDNVGNVLAQFKNKNGGPGDIYIYWDVPITVYRKWISTPSKGHYFWMYIRNVYPYTKLTGNKRGVLPNAIN